MATILGIRHHGVGSAKRVLRRLQELKPDLVLVEGPPEIEELFIHVKKEELVPPVAIMVYDVNNPQHSSFYPFAHYSPEWVAIKYAHEAGIPVKAIDLPVKINLAIRQLEREEEMANEEATTESAGVSELPTTAPRISRDPLSYLSDIAGFRDSEQWWEYQFERSPGSAESSKDSEEDSKTAEHFEAVLTAMKSLREANIPSHLDSINLLREAYMRKIMRTAEKEMYQNVAVICGAWHAPALVDLKSYAKTDRVILKEMPKSKIKVKASWIPWTNDRLSLFSGYGAGITSPGWYEHQWSTQEDSEINWLTKVAAQFREEGMDMSTAHVLEAYKLASALCQIRQRSHVSLNELNEATLTVMCQGDPILIELIRKKLIVGANMGSVPEDIPKVPLQENFEKTIRGLRLKLNQLPKDYHLDLRKENDLKRSVLFHRLEILDIPWAERIHSRTKGTFKESWRLEWRPEMIIALVDKAFLGNTVESAAVQQIANLCQKSNKISELAEMINRVIPAELNESTESLLTRIATLSTISNDVVDLMAAMGDLVHVQRYGNVRNSDLGQISGIIERFFTKIFIGLPNACYGLDEESSNKIFEQVADLQNTLKIYENSETADSWYSTLATILEKDGIHDIIQGCTCRLLLDAEILTDEQTREKIGRALSTARDPYHVASWIEGFLRGSGMILIYDNRLWNLLYQWIDQLDEDLFKELLPYLRRAFSKFQYGERRQVGAKAKQGMVDAASMKLTEVETDFNSERALVAFETIDMLLGKLPKK